MLPHIRDAGIALAREILDDFYVPEKDAIIEFVTTDGRPVNSPEGRACVPRHAIESLWFPDSGFSSARATSNGLARAAD